jgi:hypothetical protein
MKKLIELIARIIVFFDPEVRKQRRELRELENFSRMLDRANEASERFLEEDETDFGPGASKPFYGEIPPPKKEDFKF